MVKREKQSSNPEKEREGRERKEPGKQREIHFTFLVIFR